MSSRSVRFVGPRALVLLAVLTVLGVLAPLTPASPAWAAVTFTVTAIGDGADLNANDNVCDAGAAPGAQCTLRAAIQQANVTPRRDTIRFNIAGPGVKSIKPKTALPVVSDPAIIDGYSQPGTKPNTRVATTAGTNAVLRIELDGSLSPAGTTNGLIIDAPNVLVRGLVINRFERGGIIVGFRSPGTRVVGCFVGTDAGGIVDRGNGFVGVELGGAANIVVGGPNPADRNLISGNEFDGVETFGEATGRRVEGNLIGVAKDGAGALGNAFNGVDIGQASVTIGGDTPSTANVIAFNGQDGVALSNNPSPGNRILRNSIFANDDLGIDIFGNGPDPNDPGDGDTGPNNRQNTPVITTAIRGRGGSSVSGTFNSTSNATFTLRFFANPNGGNEGKTFLGQQTVSTDGAGNTSFSFTPTRLLAVGETVTGTATSAGGDTSEFSPPRTVT